MEEASTAVTSTESLPSTASNSLSNSTASLSNPNSPPPPPPAVTKTGVLFKKSKSFWKSGWKEKHFVLNGSSLYYYEKSTSEAAQGVIQLQSCKLITETTEKRKFAMILQAIDKIWYLAAKSEAELDDWLKAFTDNMKAPANPPPEKPHRARKGKVSSQIVDTATNIQVVRKIIKDFVSDDTFVVMAAIKSFVSVYDTPEQAEALETIVLQVGAKIALLYRDKKVTRDYFLPAVKPLHKLCDKLIDGFEIPFAFNPQDVILSIYEIQGLFEKMFKPYLPDKTMKALIDFLAYFANEDLLADFFTKKKWKETAEVGITLRSLWDNGML